MLRSIDSYLGTMFPGNQSRSTRKMLSSCTDWLPRNVGSQVSTLRNIPEEGRSEITHFVMNLTGCIPKLMKGL
jgi:hypothetical protein